jgi:hypothetical protein
MRLARSAGNAGQQALEPGLGTVDFLVQLARVGARRSQLAPQLDVLGAQPFAQRHELRHLRFQRIELRLHARTLCFKNQARSSR